jgi:hypothetical protein
MTTFICCYQNISFGFQRAEAMQLVRDAIAAGIFNDLGSGSNVDLCVITKDKVDYIRPYDEANLKGRRYAGPAWFFMSIRDINSRCSGEMKFSLLLLKLS